MRVYAPADTALLRLLYDGTVLPAAPDRFVAADDDEETEYAALMAAAEASYDEVSGRRAVVVAELPDDADPDGPVEPRHVVAVHADPPAVVAQGGRPGGDLAWYAVQELDQLL